MYQERLLHPSGTMRHTVGGDLIEKVSDLLVHRRKFGQPCPVIRRVAYLCGTTPPHRPPPQIETGRLTKKIDKAVE